MSGSSGAVLGIRLLESLKPTDWEVHLTLTEPAELVIKHETGMEREAFAALADQVYRPDDLFAPIASGSLMTHGMVVIPCSMKTVAGIACGYADNLLLRAADVCLKECRKLVLVPRESPLSSIHLENMQKLTAAGAVMVPPVMTMYTMPKSIDDMVDHIVNKVLDILGIEREDGR
jgi:4-hydroxy-3-polyprenylbenzoate decarboxylase